MYSCTALVIQIMSEIDGTYLQYTDSEQDTF
jgi:hypothetical protein